MQEKYARWIDFLYGPFFRVIGFFYRIYAANRARVQRLKSSQWVSRVLGFLALAVLLGWILVWLFASEESRNRLTEEVRQTIGGFGASSAE